MPNNSNNGKDKESIKNNGGSGPSPVRRHHWDGELPAEHPGGSVINGEDEQNGRGTEANKVLNEPDDEEDLDQYEYDNYDEYLEEGYEEDPEKDLPQDCDLEYLRTIEDEEDEYGNDYSSKRRPLSPLLRLVALMTVLAFLGLAIATSWPVMQFPLAELVGKSLQLQKDIDVQRLQEAVVRIEVVSQRQGAAITAQRKSGTGFNISREGLIVTNHHVIDGALNMSITFPDGKIYRAENWASKPEFDLAIIKLQAEDLPMVPVNTGVLPPSGDKIRVVGNPLGLNNVVVEGKVDRYVRLSEQPEPVLSIEAPVYPGNSGSPVFDKNGEVVAVVFARYQRDIEGKEIIFGLAVPISEVLKMQNDHL